MTDDTDNGLGEIRVSWRRLAQMLSLPPDVEIVGAEIRYPETVDLTVTGPGLPHVDCGAMIPRVFPRPRIEWDVFVEDDLKQRK